MHIIFGYVTRWQIPMLRILNYFKLKVFYLYIEGASDFKKNEIAQKLKKNGIFPLPIEFQEKISPKTYSLRINDSDEVAYKKNERLISDEKLKKYCGLFSISEKKIKKLRLMLQEFISFQQMYVSGNLGIWSSLYPEKKIIYVSFKFKCFYNLSTGKNIFKIIIPLDIFKFTKIIIRKIFLIFTRKKGNRQTNEISNSQNFNELSKKTAAFIPHKGLVFGSDANNMFEKSLYYSNDEKSCLNKYNILHLDYSNYSSPEKDICWVFLNRIKISNIRIFLKTAMVIIKTFYLIRSWRTFLVWVLFVYQYKSYIKYYEIIKKFKNLKIALIDYEALCPKTLILALENNNIKTIATQERFIHTFFKSWINVILDTYYVGSEFTANFFKNSKYHDIKNVIPMGLYRSDYFSLYKKKDIPVEISKAKENGKKVIVFLGYHSPNHWFDSYHEPLISWSAQISFLEDVIKFSEKLNNTFVVLRYKHLDWITNLYFKNILNKINKCENIIISSHQKVSNYAYKLCANADLIIAKHTSIADECLAHEIPVLFYDYTHNMKGAVSDAFDYSPSGLMCYNFEEILEKSKSLLFDDSSKLKNEIAELNKTIYYVKEKGNIKNKIIVQLEHLISQNNLNN